MKRIMVIEDEAHVVSFINKGLSEEGFEVSVAFDGKTGLQMVRSTAFDLIILDVMLPDTNGIAVCKSIREEDAHIPILFLTALGTSENVVMGLEAGADDYLVKPFKFIELVARVRSLLRRAAHAGGTAADPQDDYIYRVADLVLNDYTKTLTRNEEPISLTTTEYRMMLFFLKHKNKVLSRADILENVWGVNFDMGTNVVDVYVNYLRKKIDKVPGRKLIHTVIGMGYVLREP
ncbi:response regulator transcription factor [Parapedobacter sp. ISTM3]|uniref:DNA-binding response regulator, OmpR family, contains REC and winged-helix (WHTH) domain n=1 Tax=Parapedobacter luteus TaxID=623280 RepID=A0A1T4ZSQ2_9SPHI|nr:MULTISPECIES: response regulator transcription factor [Parapedobacter]MBK1438576.1 response regulator transcription factor [Parapedobacter sp. ISTM3]SKB25760.1 DNA-binding response regulator, OmpR family, contains REC and winged-helix (wHTH) domain [Parapedobacter luteus]